PMSTSVVLLVDLATGRQTTMDLRAMTYSLFISSSNIHQDLYTFPTQHSSDLIARHNAGREKTTRSYRPFRLIHKEIFSDRVSARARGTYVKTGVRMESLKHSSG